METFQTEEEVKKQITKYYEDNGYRTKRLGAISTELI